MSNWKEQLIQYKEVLAERENKKLPFELKKTTIIVLGNNKLKNLELLNKKYLYNIKNYGKYIEIEDVFVLKYKFDKVKKIDNVLKTILMKLKKVDLALVGTLKEMNKCYIAPVFSKEIFKEELLNIEDWILKFNI